MTNLSNDVVKFLKTFDDFREAYLKMKKKAQDNNWTIDVLTVDSIEDELIDECEIEDEYAIINDEYVLCLREDNTAYIQAVILDDED